MRQWLIQSSINHPKTLVGSMILITLLLILGVAVPTLWPGAIPLPPVRVDTDPENMLDADEAIRVFHNEMKRDFVLNEIIVVGVVNNHHPEGVFNPESLRRIYDLTEYAKTLQGSALGLEDEHAGVVAMDIIAPSTVDNIEQGGLGEVKFEWLMPHPPETEEEALAVRNKAEAIPFLKGTMVSDTGKALALYLPITSKDLSYRIYSKLNAKIAELGGDDEWHITGLPVANDTFGVEMFIQMAISAPLAMLVIFLLMLYFFRKPVLIMAPMILSLVIVIINMALLVMTGNTIHIMSSMIPIFIMPISILDSIHICSEFFENYQRFKDRKKTIEYVMDTLFTAMLYTSLTSAAGFASLAVTPIPPVQVFGIFVAMGVMIAWILTVTFIPAYIMLIPERSLEKFGASADKKEDDSAAQETRLGRFLAGVGRFSYGQARIVLIIAVLLSATAIYGISRIQVNDNPTRWFKPTHPIRVADRVLNEHFGGTYMAYLSLSPKEAVEDLAAYAGNLEARLRERIQEPDIPESIRPELLSLADAVPAEAESAADADALLSALQTRVNTAQDALMDTLTDDAHSAEDFDEKADAWDEIALFVDMETQRGETFKQPEALAYIEAVQKVLEETGIVGKSNSLADIVKTVHRELMEGDPSYFRIPDSARAVAQCLITYESSHRPQDIGHFVTHDYRNSSIWVQLKSGNNQDMKTVEEQLDRFISANAAPLDIESRWFGLTYINVIWQEKMVFGMLQSFLGSFLIVLLMMVIMFRSGLWGLISMIPLTVTIGFIYGMVGLIGKDYDMPVAVLSSLTLGMAVDFAIHFLSRSRDIYETDGPWVKVYPIMFDKPIRAIVRNVIAVAIGFTPLLLAPLVPYNTVGIFMAAILGISGVSTLLILPSLVRYLEPLLFPKNRVCRITCHCGTCLVTAVIAAAAVAVNVPVFMNATWTNMTMVSLAAMAISASICYVMSRRRKCQTPAAECGEKE
ncbi:MAG: MMPL family transporter [Candidatus Hydrogenedentes bacterium]|nr:MMPL family transporter [Candidatus Hydrogenedentota bacterium]